MKLRWGIGLGLLAVVAVGCDVSVCTKDVDGHCFDGPDFDFDAGTRIDASTDSGAHADGAVSPDSAVLVDSAVADSGTMGIDGSVAIDAGPARLSIEDFCDAQYRTAKAWRDKMEECCLSDLQDRELILQNAFFYTADSVDKCIAGIKASEGAKLTFVPTSAPACAARFSAQFPAAPTACPPTGFDSETLEATIGHGVSSLNQLTECQPALLGHVGFNSPCTNAFECQAGTRCLGTDGAKTCRDALSRGNPCTGTSECASGLVCMGLETGSGGRVCYPSTEPLEVGSSCKASTECRPGLLCVNNKCATPQPDLICKP